MAVVLAFRLAIYAAAAGTARIYTAQGAGAPGPLRTPASWLEQWLAGGSSDEDLGAALSEANGYTVVVATVNDPFEARRVQVSFSQGDQATPRDDLRVMTIDLLKGADGTPTDTWIAGDFTAVKTAINTFWTSINPHFIGLTALKRIAFYKIGPDVAPPQPPVHSQDYAVAGSGSGSVLPPQVAISVTEMAGEKPHWGRFYLPAPAVTTTNLYGRLSGSAHSVIADAVDVMYTAFKTGGTPAVVYRRELPVRTRKDGVELPARGASAWTVDKIQVDDVFDVIRSRRWKYPTLKLQRDIT